MRWFWVAQMLGLWVFSACVCRRTTPVPQRVLDAGSVSAVTLPDAGYQLAWISETSGLPQVVLDGVPITAGPAAHYLSTAHAHGLIVTRVEGGFEQLMLVASNGTSQTLSAPSPRARHAQAAGEVILFESGLHGLSQIATINDTAIVDHPAGSFAPSLAAHGQWFAFVSSRDGDAEIYRASIDGGQLHRLTAFHRDDVAPQVSPDGRWVAFVSNRQGTDRLFVIRSDGTTLRRVTGGSAQAGWPDYRADEETDAIWSPDSSALVFAARRKNDRWQLYRIEITGTQPPRQLTFADGDHQSPTMSPDGHWLAWVSTQDGNAEIYAMPIGGTPLRVTDSPAADWRPAWVDLRAKQSSP